MPRGQRNTAAQQVVTTFPARIKNHAKERSNESADAGERLVDRHIRRGEMTVSEIMMAQLPRQTSAAEEQALADARDEDEQQHPLQPNPFRCGEHRNKRGTLREDPCQAVPRAEARDMDFV